jgi:hypothetical protein
MLVGGLIKGAFALPFFFFSTNNILQGAKQGDIDRRQSGCGYKLSLLHRFDRGCCDRTSSFVLLIILNVVTSSPAETTNAVPNPVAPAFAHPFHGAHSRAS